MSACSGLILNADKTEILRLGNTDVINEEVIINYRAKSLSIKMLRSGLFNGIYVSSDSGLANKLNFEKIQKGLTGQLVCWQPRALTLLKRILIVNIICSNCQHS